SIACVAIWSGVIGSASDMVGVWIEPVIAQVMTTLLASWGMRFSALGLCRRTGAALQFRLHHSDPIHQRDQTESSYDVHEEVHRRGINRNHDRHRAYSQQ